MNIRIDLYVRLILAIVITFIHQKVLDRLREKGALGDHKVPKTFGIDTPTIAVFIVTLVITLLPLVALVFAVKPEWLFAKQAREKVVGLAPDLLKWLSVSWVVVFGAQLILRLPFLTLFKMAFGSM